MIVQALQWIVSLEQYARAEQSAKFKVKKEKNSQIIKKKHFHVSSVGEDCTDNTDKCAGTSDCVTNICKLNGKDIQMKFNN